MFGDKEPDGAADADNITEYDLGEDRQGRSFG